MPGMPFKPKPAMPGRSDMVSLLLVVVLMVVSWFLINGVATAVYQQYASFGDPPKTMGPSGGIAGSQQGHHAYFWSERAFHYRTTLMFALDDFDDPGTLSKDTLQQYPEGVNAWSEYTLLMEPVYGQLYRWFAKRGESLVDFLLRLIPLVHVLLFIPIFLLARGLGIRPWLSLAGVLIFASCTMGFSRLTGSLLLKENFSLLWLLIFLAAHHHALLRRYLPSLVVAALAMILALASWHLSQFLFLVVFLAAGFSSIWKDRLSGNSVEERAGGFWPGFWFPPAVYLVAGILAGFTPSLLSRGFFISLPMMVLLAWLLFAWGIERNPDSFSSPWKRLGLWLALLLVLGLAGVFNPLVQGDYSHVSGLFLQKIRHGFVRPDDPSGLPFDVRVFWAPPFNSPGWQEISSKLGFHFYLLLAGGFWLALAALRGPDGRRPMGFLLTTLGYLFGWLMIERIGVVFWPLAAVAIVLASEQILARRIWPGRGNPQLVVGALLLLPSVLNVTGILKPQIGMARQVHSGQKVRLGVSDAETAPFKVDLFDWFRNETAGPGSAFASDCSGGVLGEIGVSPQILLYSRRPIVLNSQFENSFIRERYRTYLELLFSTDEKALEDFLRKTGTAYLFINRNWATTRGPGSVPWLAGLTGDVSMDMMIARLHFRPDSFSFLQPMFDNEYYRVYRVGQNHPSDSGSPTWQGNHDPWWADENFTLDGGQLVDPEGDHRRLNETEQQWQVLQGRLQAILAPLNQRATRNDPPLMALHQQLLQLYSNKVTGEGEAGSAHIQELRGRIMSVLKRPHPVQRKSVGQLLSDLWRGTPGQIGMEQLLATAPAGPVSYASAGQLLGMLGEYEMAADQLQKAASFFPLQPMRRGTDGRPITRASVMASRLRQECVWWNIGAQRFEQAGKLAADYLPFETPGTRRASLYRSLVKATRKSQ